MKQKFFINTHKGATFIAVLVMMGLYQEWDNGTAWTYLAMHGTYGFLWVAKSRIFPDKQWDQECSIGYGLYIWAGLSLYWIAPWLITSQSINVPSWFPQWQYSSILWVCFCTLLQTCKNIPNLNTIRAI